MRRFVLGLAVTAILITIAIGMAATQIPAIGAAALLFPTRHITTRLMPAPCVEKDFDGVDVALKGWECTASGAERRGTIIYLHGVADNRGSAIGVIQQFVPRGFAVIAYDGRAHGLSGGSQCTYGYYEKRDLQRVLDQLDLKNAILIGHSLGAAVALQAAAIEPRVRAVVAVSTFSDLRTIATEHASFYPSWSLGPAFSRAERDGHFVVDDVSPVKSAMFINVPVLLIHGANDRDTLPVHSQRVFDALRGPKQLIFAPAAGHNDVITSQVLEQIADWLNPLFPK